MMLRSRLSVAALLAAALIVSIGGSATAGEAGPVLAGAASVAPVPAIAAATVVKPAGSDLHAPVPARVVESVTEPAALDRIVAECRTGSLLFSQGDCLAVRVYTGSCFTHVATTVCEGGELYVYDSMNGAGVRKLPLADYLIAQSPDSVLLFHPTREFTVEESARYQAALDAELGRPYSANHHLTGKRDEGLHCAEYITDALISIDWLRAENPVKVSPGSLATGIAKYNVYVAGSQIEVPAAAPADPPPVATSWCGRLWQSTKSCTVGSCRQMSRWFLCR